ncbi:hypothetical protein Pan216_14810 [Planctomycetes bacterium Pan216]|uniref:Ion transport domain-containing protein n=1 Tax=Kolteria novifilia TaxID=2527975 RepID=A0A518B0Y9_9BACT|nr:hypothetical protein Pan216_14810 [Planctomycetes bacterium Pan216]
MERPDGMAAHRTAWVDRVLALAIDHDATSLIALARAITEGSQLKRDGIGIDLPDAEREIFDRALAGLEDAVFVHLSEHEPTESDHRELIGFVNDRLAKDEEYLGELIGRSDLTPLERAVLFDEFRRELHWIGGVVACLDEEERAEPDKIARVELDRVQRRLLELPSSNSGRDGRKIGQLHVGHQQLQRALLVRRLHEETSLSVEEGTPAERWQRRFQLSRLQSDIASLTQSLDEADDAHDPDQWATPEDWDEPLRWAHELSTYRHRLASSAEEALLDLDPRLRRDSWEEVIITAQGESNEITASLEERDLPSAVRVLEMAQDDLEVLASTADRLEKGTDKQVESDERVGNCRRRMNRLRRLNRNECQEKRVSLRLEQLIGRRAASFLENTILVLILVMAVVISLEMILESTIGLSHTQILFFAGADLVICSIFLSEFFLKLSLAERRGLYFMRHCLVDFFAAIPFGFLFHSVTIIGNSSLEAVQLIRLARFARLSQVARYVRVALPVVRFFRLVAFTLRAADQLVRRHAWLLNRNIILFEPNLTHEEPCPYRWRLQRIRDYYQQQATSVYDELELEDQLTLLDDRMNWLRTRVAMLPPPRVAEGTPEPPGGQGIRAEAVIDRLIEMTPEELVERMGSPFAESISRYVKMLDVPLIRRIPFVRELVANRQQGASEVAALASNMLGHGLRGMLDVCYYFADLQGTITGPIFIDRLGTAITKATNRPAKRLLILGAALFLFYVVIRIVPVPSVVMSLVEKLERLLGVPVIVLGVVCFVLWRVGVWLQQIANQASDFCERVVEAQFASHTKQVKARHRDEDFAILRSRVIRPEIALRTCDDLPGENAPLLATEDTSVLKPSESLFVSQVEFLYEDYLDGSLFHRNDTKTTTQLLGNLALWNFRLSDSARSERDERRLLALDLGRAGSLFGGPYLWFNYITRMIAQHTAKLLVDYNRQALPLDRLQCAAPRVRRKYRRWLAKRLEVDPQAVTLPEPLSVQNEADEEERLRRHERANEMFETLDFTALDFLTENPARDEQIREKYGDHVAYLLKRDRRENVRQAFRSAPLHEAPIADRTFNLYQLYETYFSGGNVIVLPLRVWWRTMQLLVYLLRRLTRVIVDTLDPRLDGRTIKRVDSFGVAKRKIHRMRKPVFMESLWLRSRFDIEYVGLDLPDVPIEREMESTLDKDLDFIEASRRDRLVAERLRREHQRRLRWIHDWLREYGCNHDQLPTYLQRHAPHLVDRSAEVTRAVVTAFVIDFDDIYSLASAIDGLRRIMVELSDPTNDGDRLPWRLPDRVAGKRNGWYLPPKRSRKLDGLFELACFPKGDEAFRKRVKRCLKKHRSEVKGWVKIALDQGGDDPVEVLRSRLASIIRRTDLWSDQLIGLRAIQTLTMLDVHRYCEMVWKLGDYDQIEPMPFESSDVAEQAEGAA